MITLISLLESTKFTRINVPAFSGNWFDCEWLETLPLKFDRCIAAEMSGLKYDKLTSELNNLVASGAIIEVGRVAVGRGRPKVTYEKTSTHCAGHRRG